MKSRNPDAKSGIYKIQLPNQRPVVVDCVFEDGNAFTVIQKRTTGVLSFKRSWREYKEGFTSWEEPSKYGYRNDLSLCHSIYFKLNNYLKYYT